MLTRYSRSLRPFFPARLLLLAVCCGLALCGRAQDKPSAPPLPAVNHEFDFWAGDWEVFDRASGQKIGENKVESLHAGRVFRENWVSHPVDQYSGTSITSFDAIRGVWRQFWSDSAGQVVELTGVAVNGQLVLLAQQMRRGKWRTTRGTWTNNPDGTVRQLWETSADQGATWQPFFDGIYKRKP